MTAFSMTFPLEEAQFCTDKRSSLDLWGSLAGPYLCCQMAILEYYSNFRRFGLLGHLESSTRNRHGRSHKMMSSKSSVWLLSENEKRSQKSLSTIRYVILLPVWYSALNDRARAIENVATLIRVSDTHVSSSLPFLANKWYKSRSTLSISPHPYIIWVPATQIYISTCTLPNSSPNLYHKLPFRLVHHARPNSRRFEECVSPIPNRDWCKHNCRANGWCWFQSLQQQRSSKACPHSGSPSEYSSACNESTTKVIVRKHEIHVKIWPVCHVRPIIRFYCFLDDNEFYSFACYQNPHWWKGNPPKGMYRNALGLLGENVQHSEIVVWPMFNRETFLSLRKWKTDLLKPS